jgi:hypothetical protein
MAVITVKVVSETPIPAQGETEARSNAEPKANKIKLTEAATKAPQKIAAHDTADWDDSWEVARTSSTTAR